MPSGSNPNSRKNLRPIRDHKTAVEKGKRSAQKRKEKATRIELLHKDIEETITETVKVPESLYKSLKEYGVKITRNERMDNLIFHRALFKALKDGNIDPLLKLADFAGFSRSNIKLNANVTNDVNVKRNVVINFRQATQEDAK